MDRRQEAEAPPRPSPQRTAREAGTNPRASAGPRHDQIADAPSCEQQLRADVALLIPPTGLPTAPNGLLHRLIRLLALAPSDQVRRLIILHLYHGLTIDAAAERIGATSQAAAREQFESVAARERAVDAVRRNESKLRLWQEAEERKQHA